jgi:hypothetical protein
MLFLSHINFKFSKESFHTHLANNARNDIRVGKHAKQYLKNAYNFLNDLKI